MLPMNPNKCHRKKCANIIDLKKMSHVPLSGLCFVPASLGQ